MKPKVEESNFREVINEAVSEGRHVEYFKNVLEEYKDYQQAFEKIFTEKSKPKTIHLFDAKFLREGGPLWRKIEILGKQTFCDLAEEIIASMGWDNDHMHAFFLGEPSRSPGMYAPHWPDDPHPTFKTDEIKIADVDYKKQPILNFVFDFGDGHRFKVKFEGVRELETKEKLKDFPRLIDQRGVGPEQYPIYEE